MNFFKSGLWKRTNDIRGHEPTFTVRCKMCRPRWRLGYKMVLRNSRLMIVKIEEEVKLPIRAHINRMNYKCPSCDWVVAFIIPDDQEYINKVLEIRRGTLYYPGLEEWSKNALIKEKLEALGYF